MKTYYRSLAYTMRAFIGIWWLGGLLIPFTWSKEDWPPWSFLLLFYAGGLFITSILWLTTVVILKIVAGK